MNIKAWERQVREYGCVVTRRCDVQLHHVAGRTYRHNKVHIGRYFILPLCWDLHDVHSNHPHNVTHWRHTFTDEYGTQRDLFAQMCADMQEDGLEIPPTNILEVIADTRY